MSDELTQKTLEQDAERKRAALRTWALNTLPPTLSLGYRAAMESRDPAEIRKWVELLAKFGAVVPSDQNQTSSLTTFQFTFLAATPGAPGAKPTPQTIDSAAVEEAVLKAPAPTLPDAGEEPDALPPVRPGDLTPLEDLLQPLSRAVEAA